MRQNIQNEQKLFQRNEKKRKIFQDFENPEGVAEKIKETLGSKESVFLFESGIKAKFVNEKKIVNEETFNCFQVYDVNIYDSLQKIKKITKDACVHYEINQEKNKYYIASSYSEKISSEYWYDFGGLKIPVFCGYWFLDVGENSTADIEGQVVKIDNGTIILFESGYKISMNEVSKCIPFSLSTLSKIKNHYPQRWMPI